MAERSVSVRLRAEVSGYMASMRAASKATADWSRDLIVKAEKNRAALDHVGTMLLGIGTAATAGLAMATKAAVDWESAWVGVQKTVDGSAQEMAALEGELREMARTLPLAHDEIAGVAAAAGQLGIAREDIADFSRVMIDLGQTTNLASDEAAQAIARFSNIMGTSHSDVDRLGSALVDLGNNSATTEADIMSMASRMAGAGALIGATEADVLAMATALSSIGIEAEAGGGSMSRVMQQIYSAVQQGGKAVEGFARVAGVSAEQFAQSFRDDPVSAINQFVQGLNRVEASGGNVVATLQNVGIRSSEDMRTVLGLKGATDLLSESLELSAAAWDENTALADEAQQRYDTAASKIQVAWNTIKDAAITVGGAIAPVVTAIAESIGWLVDGFASLPGPVQTSLGVLTGVVGVLGLMGGAALLLLPRIADTRRAMSDLGITATNMRTKMSSAGDRIARVGDSMRRNWKATAGGMALIIGEIVRQLNKLNPQIDAMHIGLEKWAETGKASGEAARILGSDLGELEYALEAVTSNGFDKALTSFIELGTGLVGYSPFEDAKQQVEALDQALVGMVTSGNAAQAADIFQKLVDLDIVPLEKLREALPGYTAELEKAGAAGRDAGDGGTAAADGIDETAAAAADAAAEVAELVDSIAELNREFFDARASARAYEQALDDATETIAENGATLDITTQKGRDNEAALDALARAALESAEATLQAAAENGNLSATLPEVLTRLKAQQADFVAAAVAAGMEKDAAAELAEQLYRLPDDVETKIRADTSSASSSLESFIKNYNGRRINFTVAYQTSGSPVSSVPYTPFADGGLVGYADGGLPKFPAGGLFRGAGGPRDDANVVAISDGEYITNAADTARNLPALEAGNAGARLVAVEPGGRVVAGMANGGMVRGAPTVAPVVAGGVSITVNAPNYVGSQDELMRSVRGEIARSYGGDVHKALGRGSR